MDGYQQRTNKKKEAIRRAAFELFCEYGLEKTSLAEIAKKANVSPVTIYNYYGTKEQLAHTVICSFTRDIWENRIRMLESDLPFPDKIKNMMVETVEFTSKMNGDLLQSMMENDSLLRHALMDIYHEYLPKLMAFLERGKKEGYIDPELSTEAILAYFELLSETRIVKLFQAKDNSKLVSELMRIFFYGLLRQPE